MFEFIHIVTSDNLNSSSFIRPSQPNTSEINPKTNLDDGKNLYISDDVCFVTDLRTFEKKLSDNKDISLLFNINPGYKRTVIESVGDFNTPYSSIKTSTYILINDIHPKKSNFSIYLGKTNVIVMPLTSQFKQTIISVISRAKNMFLNSEQNKPMKQI